MSKIVKFEFKKQLHSFNLDGWFNATEAAVRFGAEPFDWLRQRETVAYIVALCTHLGNSGFVPELKKINDLDGKSAKSRRLIMDLVKRTGLVRTKAGAPETGGGTWLHPKLAVPFARWLNVDFAVWCDMQIDALIRNGIRAEGNVNLLSLYLRDTAAEWEVRFTPEYYHALARLTCTRYSGHSGGTPACYGQITDKWVYGCLLPPDVHAELKARRGDSVKMHQWLTSGGQGLLDKQIDLVTTFARSSADLRDFEARMMTVTQRGGQMGIIFPRAA